MLQFQIHIFWLTYYILKRCILDCKGFVYPVFMRFCKGLQKIRDFVTVSSQFPIYIYKLVVYITQKYLNVFIVPLQSMLTVSGINGWIPRRFL